MLMGDSDINPYLQQEIASASPARLRWMLIRRAHELTTLVGQLWTTGQQALGDQWLLRIREILGELLAGVHDRSNPLSPSISDFYLFLLQLVTETQQTRDGERLEVMRDLLAIEAETWQLVVEKLGSQSLPAPTIAPAPLGNLADSLDLTSSGSFSLEI